MKIIYSAGYSSYQKHFAESWLKEIIQPGYDITPIDHRQELGVEKAYSPAHLNRLFALKDKTLLSFYQKIEGLAEAHDVLLVDRENVFHPEFVKSLGSKRIYTAIVSGDDPEASDDCSKPYVHAFDHSFCLGVNFDNNTKITEKFLQWGAKRANWWPYGVRHSDYDASLTEADIFNQNRDIDLVYVGNFSLKLERIVEIKKAFPHMTIYCRGGWNWRGLLGNPLTRKRVYGRWNTKAVYAGVQAIFLGLGQVKELPATGLVPLYQRCKIGINFEQSYGPSNVRTYQLPANGVMQVADNPEGLSQVFELGKEVVAYRSPKEAIEQIIYFLKHDEERKKIAAAGFRRTMKDYKRPTTFARAMGQIKQGMLADGLRHFKDGTPIKVTGLESSPDI